MISSATQFVEHGATIEIKTPAAAEIQRVVLARPAAVTHQTDSQQRSPPAEFSGYWCRHDRGEGPGGRRRESHRAARPLHALHPQSTGCAVRQQMDFRSLSPANRERPRSMFASSHHEEPGWREQSMRWCFTVIALISWSSALLGQEVRVLEFPDFTFESGPVVPQVKLAYTTRGTLNEQKSNAILLPSNYGADHTGYDYLIGPGKALDPTKDFLILTNLFANGLSSSPSNTPDPFRGPRFPRVSIRDNVEAQHRLVREKLGISQAQGDRRLCHGGTAGVSMGRELSPDDGINRRHLRKCQAVPAWNRAASRFDQGAEG